ncbi:MAG: fatty acid desaturase [Candidatus Eisenbacteria bacterium]|uniref:Fatty acid desaturase n=1 Tax=Eiseniibacteriota bacterium TaxID=2212470 RepID=A0A948RX91_UNCEI|nr:fatty acid desaturase [Candidatus Eisenbacteria bacterium]MBU1949823.1 fatty acid desaturase [Candidatus Eisenbacteria bacterium]MBU2692718.1 fatty acid desaturase [Candidatus Eisenbacteria bacterium]
MKPRSYSQVAPLVKKALKDYFTIEEMRDLHRVETSRHFGLAIRHILLSMIALAILFWFKQPIIWIPVALFQGFQILGFTILLHEQVHEIIFRGRRPRLNRLMGLIYAFPSSISATQFRIWHLDHHKELGSSVHDPKRAYLTPKIVKRWYKLLYLTPFLFVIYSIASKKEAATYTQAERRLINIERTVGIFLHLIFAALLVLGGGWNAMLRVWFIPLFLAFPIAFTLNRLGQHYDINPDDPINWATLINSHPFWDFIFLYSNFHLEHHYFPRVPFYRLKELNERLQGFYTKHGVKPKTYGGILRGWFIENKTPHTDWYPPRKAAALSDGRPAGRPSA